MVNSQFYIPTYHSYGFVTFTCFAARRISIMHDLHFLVFIGEFHALFVRPVERDKRGLWKPPSSTTWSWAGDCDPSKCGGCARSRSRSHVDRLRAISRLGSTFFFSRVSRTTVEAAVTQEEGSSLLPLILISFFIYIYLSVSRFFSDASTAIHGVEHFHRILLRGMAQRNRTRHLAFGNYRRVFMIPLRKESREGNFSRSGERNSEMMTTTA